MSLSFINLIVEQLGDVLKSLRRQVLQFARTFRRSRLTGNPSSNLLRFASSIESDDLALMRNAIEEDCEQLDLEEW